MRIFNCLCFADSLLNIKGWLRDLHNKYRGHHYHKYEYCFRINPRNIEQGLFAYIIGKVVKIKTQTFKELKAYAANVYNSIILNNT
jgi:hypothetical protein